MPLRRRPCRCLGTTKAEPSSSSGRSGGAGSRIAMQAGDRAPCAHVRPSSSSPARSTPRPSGRFPPRGPRVSPVRAAVRMVNFKARAAIASLTRRSAMNDRPPHRAMPDAAAGASDALAGARPNDLAIWLGSRLCAGSLLSLHREPYRRPALTRVNPAPVSGAIVPRKSRSDRPPVEPL